VKPIDVSTERPFRMAAAEQPFPRWSATSETSSTGVSVSYA
jgi:hypothetical protein